jgi:hypothetical protein
VTGAVLGKGMLDLPAVLRRAAGAPNLRSIILEMTAERNETELVEAVIHREREAVLESRAYFSRNCPKVFLFGAIRDRKPAFFGLQRKRGSVLEASTW